MGRILGLILIGLLGFYVAWPAYSGYRIKTALDANDAAVLSAKIDFDSVRESLRPAVSVEADKAVTAAIERSGGDNRALLEQVKTQLMPKVVETALTSVVTPETLLRINREGGDIKKTIADIVAEKLGGAGGVGVLAGALGGADAKAAGGLLGTLGKAAEGAGIDPGKVLGGLLGKTGGGSDPAPPSAQAPTGVGDKPKFGLSNIKSFGMNGPLGFSVGIAKSATATEADGTVDLAFTGGDWKIVGVRPRV